MQLKLKAIALYCIVLQEEHWVLVDYIRPLWYDDHFDIVRDSLRNGKTLSMITSLEDSSVLTRSYALIGRALWEKYDEVLSLMQEWIDNGDQSLAVVAKEAVRIFFNIDPFETDFHFKSGEI